jgi:HEXXH motif-containing protein
MRLRLAHSLRYILEAISPHIGFAAAELDPFLERLRAGPVAPATFAAYCDLVLAIEAGNMQGAEHLLRELADTPNQDGGLRVLPLANPHCDTTAERYQRLVDTDPAARVQIHPPPPGLARASELLIAQAFALLERGNPELAGEIRGLLREIVLAAGTDTPGALVFDGASSFMLWGGIVINVRSHATVLDMVQVLAHESGHNLLFGLCADGPLVENDGTARYDSPLRRDPRPMDGIVHATYVCARVHQALARLLAAGVLDAGEAGIARDALAEHARCFAGGMRTVERHARLTATGVAILAGAARYMGNS